MATRDWIEVGASMLGGATLGAACMYLFDPDKGTSRRDRVVHAATDALASTGETVGQTWQSVADRAHDLAGFVSDKAENLTGTAADNASAYMSRAARRARQMGRDAYDTAPSYGSGTAREARRMFQDDQPSAGTVAMTAGGVCAALAVGAALMYLFDPAQGRRRREMLSGSASDAAKKAGHYASDAGRYVSEAGRHVSDTARKTAQQASRVAHEAGQRISQTLGSKAERSPGEPSTADRGRFGAGAREPNRRNG